MIAVRQCVGLVYLLVSYKKCGDRVPVVRTLLVALQTVMMAVKRLWRVRGLS